MIRFDFLSFGTQSSHDFVTVYDGSTRSAPIILHTSGQDLPDPVYSSGNKLLIEFYSDSSTVAAGFTGAYQSVHALQEGGCSRSGNFTLTSPQDSLGCNGYLSGVTEYWLLRSQDTHEVINLTWQSFNTQENHDIVSVYDGNSADPSTLVYTASGSNLPDPVVSTGQYLYVTFEADNDGVSGDGFAAIYESVLIEQTDPTSCQSSNAYQLTEEHGVFGCDGYANNVEVSWLIHVEDGFTIAVEFNTFFTEALYDYLTIYDGRDNTAEPIGSWSGALRPPPVASTSNYLYFVFESDAGVTRAGFTAAYNSIFSGHAGSTSCFESGSHSLTLDEGTFGCDGYGNNVDVTWSITTAAETTITLDFVSFQTELNYDQLFIYDGSSASAHLLKTYSGYTIPEPVHSSSNNLFLRFQSDDSLNYDGFSINYHSQATTHSLDICSSSTHQTLTASAGQFGCNGYGNSIEPTWLITLQEGQRITLDFTTLDTELYYDYVKIYDGSGSTATLLGTFSGNSAPPPVSSSGNSIYVVFHSDSSMSTGFAGFVIQYVSFGSFEASCNSNRNYQITDPSGTFGCDGYSSSVTVTWLIQSFGNIYVNFDQFNTETNYDTVKIYDGASDSAPLIATYSGTIAPPISSSGSSMFIKFSSDASVNRSGFSASFATIIIDYAY